MEPRHRYSSVGWLPDVIFELGPEEAPGRKVKTGTDPVPDPVPSLPGRR